jgi:rod shape-determining protein MreB and related proteins
MSDFTVGLDLGSFKTAVVASNGQRAFVETIVGWPKDKLACRTLSRKVQQKALGKMVFYGKDVHRERLALNVVRPCEKAMLKFRSPEDAGLSAQEIDDRQKAVRLLLEHVKELVSPPAGAQVRVVMGTPSCAAADCQRMMVEAAEGVFDSVIVIPEPFAVAYGVDQLKDTLVVDIGAGTTDICPIFGTLPLEEDQVTLAMGGDEVDTRFIAQLVETFPEAELSRNMAREIKERYGSVYGTDGAVDVQLPTHGALANFDVRGPLKDACETIVGPIIEGIREVISRVDPEFRHPMLRNILLSGGGSQLIGLDRRIEEELKDHGAKVNKVYDFVFAGAVGAHRMAMELTEEEWQQVDRLDAQGSEEQSVAA